MRVKELTNQIRDLNRKLVTKDLTKDEEAQIRVDIQRLEAELKKEESSVAWHFRKIIVENFTTGEPKFIKNLNDSENALEFNPTPRVMIQIRMSFPQRSGEEAGQYIYILKAEMNLYDFSLKIKNVFSGQSVRTDEGEIDYDFYEKLLVNWERL